MSGQVAGPAHGVKWVLGLVFFSGFAALVYQVLWMKQIGLLFGNTAQAAGVTLASFFAGLAVGSRVMGNRVGRAVNPLRIFAWLELGVAITALLYFLILAIYRLLYPGLYQAAGPGALMLLTKFALALLLVFPPAFCMGGTIPVLGQCIVRRRESFARLSALLYGLNTLGAAAGAALAGFFLPPWLGFNGTCGVALAVSIAVATTAFVVSRKKAPAGFAAEGETIPGEAEEVSDGSLTRQQRRQRQREGQGDRKAKRSRGAVVERPGGVWPVAILLLSFLSGFGVLVLEVVWTRLFSQVLENSVYSFAAILVVVLLFLALGAVLSSRLAHLNAPPSQVLTWLLLAGAGALIVMPTVFLKLTDGMQLITSDGSWGEYLGLIFRSTSVVIGPPALLLGTVFPYLMKLEEDFLKTPGASLGRLAAANTIGAVFGALGCGFFLLDALGMWRTVQLVALVYLLVALVLPASRTALGLGTKVAVLALIVINVLVVGFKGLPVVATDPDRPEETVLEVWEGSDCTVSVTEGPSGRTIRINSDYSLGSTGAYLSEAFQADLPLMVYPETRSVFFLGLGTGITAGRALDRQHRVARVVACELVPEVVLAAKTYMIEGGGLDLTGGLFRDRRVEILIEDGRHHLLATGARYDMINADLFVPFRSGAGSLYTLEHFQNARRRLEPGGVFVQWLPLHQLTKDDFLVIARTMVEAFDQVSMWRHNFQPGNEMVALMGHPKGAALPACSLDSSAEQELAVAGKTHRDLRALNLPLDPQTILLFYAGNLTAARSLFESVALNTDNFPVIEYLAPRRYRSGGREVPWFLGESFADFVEQVQEICPPSEDPLLAKRTEENRRLSLAGSAFHRSGLAEARGDEKATREAWERFVAEWTNVRH